MREYSILIADDEPVIREGLAELIRQSGLPFRVSALVPNGLKALEKMQEEHFDLVVTDIEMPDMDGLAFIERCIAEGFYTRYIVLSGFDRFDYARNAYRFGVDDYLLKPVNRKELYGLLSRIAEELNRERPLQSLWSRFFASPRDPDVREELDKLYKDIRGWYYVLLQSKTPLSPLRFPSEYLLVEEEDPRTLGLLLNDRGSRGAAVTEQLMELALVLREKDIFVSSFVGGRVLRYWDLPESRSRALELEPLLFYRGRNSIISCGELDGRDVFEAGGKSEFRFDRLREAGQACLGGEPFEELLDRFNQELRVNYPEPSLCRLKVRQFLYGMLPSLDSLIEDTQGVSERFSPLFSTHSDLTLNEMILMLKDFMEEVSRLREERCGNRNSALIEDILRNIRTNFVLDLNLQDLSEKYRMNKAYLGQMFKKHTGVSFITYLNDTRLEEARRLLESTDLKVYQIAYRVGYRDPSYFMSRFEKKTGLTPLAYRKSLPLS